MSGDDTQSATDEPEDRIAFIFELAAWGCNDEQLHAALETTNPDDVRRIAAISSHVYQLSRDVWYEQVTTGAVRVLPLPRNI